MRGCVQLLLIEICFSILSSSQTYRPVAPNGQVRGDRDVSRTTMPQQSPVNTVSVNQLQVSRKTQEQLQRVRVLVIRGDLVKGHQQVGKILARAPDYADALSVRARINLREGRIAEAYSDARRSLALDPQLANAHFVLGEILNREGRYEEAISSLERCVALAPKAWACHYQHARALLGMLQLSLALQEIGRAVALGGAEEEPEAIYSLRASVFLLLHDYASGTRDLETLLKISRKGPITDQARAKLERFRARRSTSAVPQNQQMEGSSVYRDSIIPPELY